MRSLRRRDHHHHQADEIDVQAVVDRIVQRTMSGEIAWERSRSAYGAIDGELRLCLWLSHTGLGNHRTWHLGLSGVSQDGQPGSPLSIGIKRRHTRQVLKVVRAQVKDRAERERLTAQSEQAQAATSSEVEDRQLLGEQAAAAALDAFMAQGQAAAR